MYLVANGNSVSIWTPADVNVFSSGIDSTGYLAGCVREGGRERKVEGEEESEDGGGRLKVPLSVRCLILHGHTCTYLWHPIFSQFYLQRHLQTHHASQDASRVDRHYQNVPCNYPRGSKQQRKA